MSVQISGNVAYLESSSSAVFFSKASTAPVIKPVATYSLVTQLVNALNVAKKLCYFGDSPATLPTKKSKVKVIKMSFPSFRLPMYSASCRYSH